MNGSDLPPTLMGRFQVPLGGSFARNFAMGWMVRPRRSYVSFTHMQQTGSL